MPLKVTCINHIDTEAPGPYTEVTVDGINANVVPDPGITDINLWNGIIAGTRPEFGIDPPIIPGAWTRTTGAFASSPSSMRCLTTGTASSGRLYVTPFIPCDPASDITLRAKVRTTVRDPSRSPSMKIIQYDQNGVEFVEPGADLLQLDWDNTITTTFIDKQGLFTVFDGPELSGIRVCILTGGVATTAMTSYFDDLEVTVEKGAKSITVYRESEGRRTPIQGAFGTDVLGETMIFNDYAVPFKTPFLYTAITDTNKVKKEVYQSAINTINYTGLWISDPISPGTAINATAGSAAMKQKTYPKEGTILTPINRTEPLSITGQRRVASDIPFVFYAYTAMQRFAYEVIFQNVTPMLIRSSPEFRIPGTCYIDAQQITEEFLDAPDEETTRFSFQGQIVASPSLDVLVPLRTYADLVSEVTNYTGLMARFDSYLEVLRGT